MTSPKSFCLFQGEPAHLNTAPVIEAGKGHLERQFGAEQLDHGSEQANRL
jgi:hypothetical protein